MNWAHLPVAGGLYDQHPAFIEGIDYIFSVKNEKEAEKTRKDEARMSADKAKGKNRPGR